MDHLLPHPRHVLCIFSLMFVFVVAGCGEPTQYAPLPTVPATPRLVMTQPAEAVRGERLPGRLLFVRQGIVWRWQDGQGQPLFGDGLTVQPRWSPDGSKIAYVQRSDSASDLVIADSAGGELAQLTHNGASANMTSFERVLHTTWALYPAWSPDGTRLIYAGQYGPPVGDPAADFNLSLFQIQVQGGTSEQLLAEEEAHVGRTVYLPDASIIYVREGNAASGQQLYRLTTGATVGEAIAGVPAGSYDPALSPDGNWLAFASRNDGQTDIWATATHGSTQQPLRLTGLGSARAPAFSPDGALLAFLAIPAGGSGFELWVVDVARDQAGNLSVGQPRQITQDLHLDADSGVSWANGP